MNSGLHASARRLPLLWRLLAVFFLAGLAHAQIVAVTESFRNSTTTSSNWTFGTASGSYTPTLTASNGTDSSGDGWLRLTSSGTNQATYAVYNTAFTAANTSVYARFAYTSYGGTGADGITFFLFDGSSSFQVGSYGGSLGYAQRTSGTTGPGMNGGYLAIGIDEFGNFSNATEGRVGGIGQTPDSISVRGPGQGYDGYAYLGGTGTLTQGIDSSSTTRPSQTGLEFREVTISISPTNQLSVYLKTGASSTPTQILTLDLSGYARPDTLRFGFTSSTGDLTNIHEIRDLNISAVTANLWDAGSTVNSSLWSSATNANWQLEYLPTTNGDVLFDNTFVSSAQSISLNNETKSLRSLSIDAPFSYNLSSGTVDINSGGGIGTSGIFVTGTKGSADHTISANVTASNDATISNNSTGLFTISGALDNGGHALNVTGSGDSNYSGVISGSGAITKSGTGNITFSGANTYSGGTAISAGTLTAGHNTALGTGSVTLTGGTLAGSSSGITVGNTISLQGNSGLSNITSSGTLAQSGGSYTLTMNNATQSGAVNLSANTSTAQTLTVQVDTGTSTISGVIANGSASGSNLTKTGLGTLALLYVQDHGKTQGSSTEGFREWAEELVGGSLPCYDEFG